MNVGEEMDRLAAEGRLTSVTLIARSGGRGWQCYLNCSVAQIADTPAGALSKTLDILPATQDYDAKYGGAAVTARALAEAAAGPEISLSANDRPAVETRNDGLTPSGEASVGIFD
ncbi:hypothetical protein [Bradyrhizobium sp. 33ap4]|uniref:hypothetical protein n=1 Tax=Bradyrhizobium sp. 33ap4 TaxID=3061630 RepID=UPI00292D04E7|nr:hypothetical protein [Bradyrhizobium sp. 33ap4]